jgi:two-component system cell cycle sensor histidine kinase/response regulator CckA
MTGAETERRPTVLVIDDDEAVRDVVPRLLEREGYGVLQARSGREALARLREGALVRLVVTDLKMTDGSGGWFIAQLGYEYPALLGRTLLVTGDASGASAAHLASRWRCPLLPKPFSGAQLLDALRQLDEPA